MEVHVTLQAIAGDCERCWSERRQVEEQEDKTETAHRWIKHLLEAHRPEYAFMLAMSLDDLH